MKSFSPLVGTLSLWLMGSAALTPQSTADSYFNLGIPSTFSSAQALTPDGSIIVGVSKNEFNQNRLFKWTEAGGMINLGAPLTGLIGSARLVSSDGGVIIGLTQGDKSSKPHVFRWTASGGMQDLPTFGGAISEKVLLMTADGSVVVGAGFDSSLVTHAFRWSEVGGLQDLGTFGGSRTSPIAISADGTVVIGTSTTASGEQRAFRWAAGAMVDLGDLGAGGSSPSAMSADGAVVVGSSATADGEVHAFRWTAGTMVDLDTLGGAFTRAQFISAVGTVIVGESFTTAGESHAVRWTEGGGIEDLGTLGGIMSRVRAISADGSVVVGSSALASGQENAFRWQAGAGAMQDLGTLGATSGEASQAEFVSADGSVIVGTSATDLGEEHFFRWKVSDLTLIDLGTLGPRSRAVVSADLLTIAGNGLTSSGDTHAFRSTATGWADLGQLGIFMGSSSITAMTPDGGTAVGIGSHADGTQKAFRWTESGGLIDLPTLGGIQSFASGVSADGMIVVGESSLENAPAPNYRRAFRWSAADGIIDLGMLDDPDLAFSTARGISADGQVIIGQSDTAEGYRRAFRWTSAQGMQSLGTVGADFLTSDPQFTSTDASVIVGVYSTLSESRVFRWTAAGMEDIGDSSLNVHAMSADGLVLVGSMNGIAFRWEDGKVNLLDGGAFFDFSEALAVSQDGTTITGAGIDALGVTHPFRWTDATGMEDLSGPGNPNSSSPTAISGDGTTIVGRTSAGVFLWTRPTGMLDLGGLLAPLAPGENITDAQGLSFDGSVIFGQASNASISHGPRYGFVARLAGPSVLANAGSDQTVNTDGATCGASVVLNGSSSIPTGLAFTWSEGGTVIATGATPTVTLSLGAHNITLVVNDAAGQTSSDTVSIVVTDATAPVPDLATLPALSGVCQVAVVTTPTATDACAGTIKGTTSDSRLYTVAGTYTITWTFDDGHGNSTTQQQVVTVLPAAVTALTYTGAISSTAGTTVTLSARLTDGTGKKAPGLPGRVISFTLGPTTLTAVTDATGNAQVTVKAPAVVGDYALVARFNGLCPYGPSSVSRSFVVKKK